MKTYFKKINATALFLIGVDSAFAEQIVWCGVDKDTGDVNKYGALDLNKIANKESLGNIYVLRCRSLSSLVV